MALQPGVGLGLLYDTPPGLSIPCSVSPVLYTHLSEVHGHIILFVLLHTSSHTSFLGLWFLAFFLYDQAIVFFGI